MKKIIIILSFLIFCCPICFANQSHVYQYVGTTDGIETYLDISTCQKYDNIYEFTNIINDKCKNTVCVMRMVANSNVKEYYTKYMIVIQGGTRLEGTPTKSIKSYAPNSAIDVSIRLIDRKLNSSKS